MRCCQLFQVVQRGILPEGSGERRTSRAPSPPALVPMCSRNPRNHAAWRPRRPVFPLPRGPLLLPLPLSLYSGCWDFSSAVLHTQACWDFSSAVLHTQARLPGTCSAAPTAPSVSYLLHSGLGLLWMDGRSPFYRQAQGWCCAPEEGSPRKKKIRKSVIDWPEHSSHSTHPFCFLKRFT